MLTTVIASESHRPDVNESAGEWASHRIWGKGGGFRDFASVTVLRDDVPIAAVILHEYHKDRGTIELSVAGMKGWQSRRVVNLVMALCFNTMRCQMVIVRCDDANHAVIRNAQAIGFSGVHCARMRGRHLGEWLFTLTDDDWKMSRLYKP